MSTLELIAPPPPVVDEVAELRQRITDLYAREREHAMKAFEYRILELDLSSSAGLLELADLESTSAVELADRLSRLHSTALLADRAVEVCRMRRCAAIADLFVAEAAQHRATAAQLHVAYSAHQATTQKLLAKLVAHEGCAYVPAGMPELGPGVYADPQAFPIARSQALLLEIQQCEAQAQACERRQPVESGAIELAQASGAAVFDALYALDAYTIAPTPIEVRAWLDAQLTPLEQKREREYTWRDAQIHLMLVWSNGTIDRTASRARLVRADT